MSLWLLRLATAVLVVLLVGTVYCVASDTSYDFSGYFVGGKYNFEATASAGDVVEWAVFDDTGVEVFRSTATTDGEGNVRSKYWKAAEVGEYSVVRYVNGEETARQSLVVQSPYTLVDTYHEDFDEPIEWCASVWNPDGYIRARTSKAMAWWSTCPIEAEAFVLEVEVSFARHTAGGAGLAFGISQDRRSCYAVGIDPQGFFLMSKMSPAGIKYIGERTPCQFIRKGLNVVNTVTVEVQAGVAYVSFNGHRCITLRDQAIPSGQTGLALMNLQGGLTVMFDNFVLSPPEGETDQPASETKDEEDGEREAPPGGMP